MKLDTTSQRTVQQAFGEYVGSVSKRGAYLWGGVVLLELYALSGYFAFTTASPSGELRYLVYPFVWINAGVWAVLRTELHPGNRLHRLLAGTIATVYFIALLWIPGQIEFGLFDGRSLRFGVEHVRIAWHAPGWGPILAVDGTIRLYLVPFELIGYASISYLVYANVLAAARGILAGALGLVTCVGCTVPVLVPLVSLVGGATTSLATTATAWSYDVGTVVFLLTIALLYWSQWRSYR